MLISLPAQTCVTTQFLGTETTILLYTPPFLVKVFFFFFFLSHLTTKRLLCLGCSRGTVGMKYQMKLEMWPSRNSEGSQNICVLQAAPTASIEILDTWRAEFATSRKGVLLTDWSFFLAAFASSDTSRLLWKQQVIITSTAFRGFYTSKFHILVTQWLDVTFTLNPLIFQYF